VFVDVDPQTMNIDPRLVREAITPRTRAIAAVHYAGNACDMGTLMEIAAEANLLVVEDAAQALLTAHEGRYLGTIGHLGCLSFHETKNVISGEGGALLVNDPALVERAEIIRDKGTNRARFLMGEVDKYTWVDIGSSFQPSDIVAAFLYGQLENAQLIVERRRALCRRYRDRLLHLEQRRCVELPRWSSDTDGNGHIFFIVCRSQEERTGLIQHLRQRGIHAVFHYIPLHSSPAGQSYGRAHGELEVTERVSATLLRLPLYFGLSDHDVDRIADEVTRFFE
jgi:dTDP-4-amino-4,6-dideoxygalactose transaminase